MVTIRNWPPECCRKSWSNDEPTVNLALVEGECVPMGEWIKG